MGQIGLEKKDGVAILTIDSPEVKNGLTPEMGLQLVAACDEIDADMTIGAAVLQGAEGTFCSGADRRRWEPGADPHRSKMCLRLLAGRLRRLSCLRRSRRMRQRAGDPSPG